MLQLEKTLARMRLTLKALIAPRTPYWRERLEDHQAPTGPDYAAAIMRQIIQGLALGLMVLLPAAYLAGIVFVHPGGLADVIGTQLGQICRATGHCDLGYLMAGYALAIVFLIVAITLIVTSVSREPESFEAEPDIAAGLAFIDARVCALRDDLVAAGVLKAQPGEKPEGD